MTLGDFGIGDFDLGDFVLGDFNLSPVDIFLAVKGFIDASDVEIVSFFIANPQKSITIQKLLESLRDFRSVTLALEKTDMNLHEARTFFNLLIENYYIMEN